MKKQKHSISVISPIYNSEQSINELFERIEKVLMNNYHDYEIILVNDSSQDNSGKIIYELGQKFNFVKDIHFSRNYGQHNALLCGIRAAKNDIIVTLDDDLQNPPEEIPKMTKKLDEGYDVVYGVAEKEMHGIFRNFGSISIKFILKKIMNIDFVGSVSDFRVFKKELRNSFSDYNGSFVFIDVLLSWGTGLFCSVKVNQDKRKFGKSNYTFRSLINHALNMIIGFSAAPLKMVSFIGFLFSFIGILVFLYIIGEYLLYGSEVPGFPFLASIISFFSGIQLLITGFIGEYLARLYFRSMNKPTYTIKKYLE